MFTVMVCSLLTSANEEDTVQYKSLCATSACLWVYVSWLLNFVVYVYVARLMLQLFIALRIIR